MPSIRRCHNENCKYNLYGSICDGVDICIDSDGCCEDYFPPIQPQTNADRIRAMSDEELAKVPAKFGYSCVFPQKECDESDTCEKCLLEWLKQPAEGE